MHLKTFNFQNKEIPRTVPSFLLFSTSVLWFNYFWLIMIVFSSRLERPRESIATIFWMRCACVCVCVCPDFELKRVWAILRFIFHLQEIGSFMIKWQYKYIMAHTYCELDWRVKPSSRVEKNFFSVFSECTYM